MLFLMDILMMLVSSEWKQKIIVIRKDIKKSINKQPGDSIIVTIQERK